MSTSGNAWTARTLAALATDRAQVGDSAGALQAAERLVAGCAADPDAEVRTFVSSALVDLTLDLQADPAAAVTVGNWLDTAFGDRRDPAVRANLARGLHNLGLYRAAAGDLPGAISAGTRLSWEFSLDSDPVIREAVAGGMRNLAIDQAQAGDLPAAIATAEMLVERYGADKATPVRAAVSGAMVNLADHLARAGRAEDAAAARQRLIAMFGADPDASVQQCVQRVRGEGGVDGPHTLSEFLGGD